MCRNTVFVRWNRCTSCRTVQNFGCDLTRLELYTLWTAFILFIDSKKCFYRGVHIVERLSRLQWRMRRTWFAKTKQFHTICVIHAPKRFRTIIYIMWSHLMINNKKNGHRMSQWWVTFSKIIYLTIRAVHRKSLWTIVFDRYKHKKDTKRRVSVIFQTMISMINC